jgi:large-conductance mechanosensitive channel
VLLALVLTLITIAIPVILYPFAVIWFGFSKLLGVISTFIMMALVFFLIVAPVGILRKLMGKDRMKMKEFKKSRQSVMVNRNHLYSAEDFLNTF